MRHVLIIVLKIIKKQLLRYIMVSKKSMNEQFLASMKSTEVCSWFELNVMRRTGFYLAWFFNKLGVHPNAITILSMILGAGSTYFYMSGSWYYGYGEEGDKLVGVAFNIVAIGMLFWADVLDNTDGQLARLSGKRSQVGRILDGAAGFVWMIPIYLGLAWRIYQHHSMEFGWFGIDPTPRNSLIYGLAVLVLVFYSGFVGCGGQQRVGDYYMQVHLLFSKEANGTELDRSEQQQRAYDQLPVDAKWWERLFMKNYINYTKKQECTTPKLQRLLAKIEEKYGSLSNMPEDLRKKLHDYSLPIIHMDFTGFSYRALSLAFFTLIDFPLGHFLFESIILGLGTLYTIKKHEAFCEKVTSEL